MTSLVKYGYMEEKQLDSLLIQIQERQVPSLPSNISQNVWREIRIRQSQHKNGWDFLPEFLLSPRILSSGLAIAFAVGIGSGIFMTELPPSNGTRGALNLQVFSSLSPDLPSTLLAQNL